MRWQKSENSNEKKKASITKNNIASSVVKKYFLLAIFPYSHSMIFKCTEVP